MKNEQLDAKPWWPKAYSNILPAEFEFQIGDRNYHFKCNSNNLEGYAIFFPHGGRVSGKSPDLDKVTRDFYMAITERRVRDCGAQILLKGANRGIGFGESDFCCELNKILPSNFPEFNCSFAFQLYPVRYVKRTPESSSMDIVLKNIEVSRRGIVTTLQLYIK